MSLTPEQAEEEYQRSRNRYQEAAYQKTYWSNQEQELRNQKKYTADVIKSDNSKRVNFEKRLDGIEKIIKILEGDGVFTSSVPRSITNANQSLQSANHQYLKCIQLSGGSGAANMEDSFKAPTVQGDTNSSQALEAYKNAKIKLEQDIKDLKAQIALLSGQMDDLSRKISNASTQQWSARSAMISSAYDMVRYKRAMN